jgi:excisionase family DNA binding protein
MERGENAHGYMRKNAVADYLGVSLRQVTVLMRRRVLPYSKIGGRLVLFRRADVDAAIDKFRITAVGNN